jgi:hypothetical protein
MEVLKEFGVTFLNLFLQLVLPPLVAVIVGFVIKWVKSKIAAAEAVLDSNTLDIIKKAVSSAVLAAEQVGLADALLDKKDYAINAAQQSLAGWGLAIDIDELDVLIEAAVMEEFNRYRVPEAEEVIE